MDSNEWNKTFLIITTTFAALIPVIVEMNLNSNTYKNLNFEYSKWKTNHDYSMFLFSCLFPKELGFLQKIPLFPEYQSPNISQFSPHVNYII